MIVRARTVYTKELLTKFAKFDSIRNMTSARTIFLYIILEGMMLAFAGFSLMAFFNGMNSGNIVGIIIGFFLAIFFAFVFPVILLLSPVLSVKKNKSHFGGVNSYEFSDNEIFIESTMPTSSGQLKTTYAYIKSAYETKDAFYLYISEQQAYIIRKLDIIEGSVADLHDILKKNIPAKKIIVK